MTDGHNEEPAGGALAPPVSGEAEIAEHTARTEEKKPKKNVLPPKKYLLKTFLMFSEFFALLIYMYFFWISSLVGDYQKGAFSFVSSRALSFYFLLGITIALLIVAFIIKITKSAKTRFARDNEVRQDENIDVWLTGFNWGWPVLFAFTVAIMVLFGFAGLLLDWLSPNSHFVSVIQDVMGGTILVLGALNAAVVIFKLKPVIVLLLVVGFIMILLMLVLHGTDTFVNFFRNFRHLGIRFEPLGYLILAYIWSLFIRIIWVRSLFFYWVITPNKLELQHGLSESNDFVDRRDIRVTIDTDDLILRLFNIGIITFYYPNMDRREETNYVFNIHKKADYINRCTSVMAIDRRSG